MPEKQDKFEQFNHSQNCMIMVFIYQKKIFLSVYLALPICNNNYYSKSNYYKIFSNFNQIYLTFNDIIHHFLFPFSYY